MKWEAEICYQVADAVNCLFFKTGQSQNSRRETQGNTKLCLDFGWASLKFRSNWRKTASLAKVQCWHQKEEAETLLVKAKETEQ